MDNENIEEVQMSEKLSANQVDEVLNFAMGVYDNISGYYANPFTQYQNLLSLNNNPQVPTYEKLLEALQSAPYDWERLNGYSEFMEVWDTIYGNTLKHFAGLLSFDLSYYPSMVSLKNYDEYNSQEYKDDVMRVEKFLNKFDYKQEFAKIVRQILRYETCYTWFRDSHNINDPLDISDKIVKEENFGLQIMPQNKCKLTGYYNSSQLLYDFDMSYFSNRTVDLDLFPPALKKKYRDLFTNKNGTYEYNPSAQLDNRNGTFAMWTQVSPEDGAYAFKMDISNFRQTPPFASLMKATFDNTTIQDLQKDKDIASAYALLMGEIKTLTDKTGGKQSGQYAISPKDMAGFLAKVQSGLKKNVRPVSLPLENTRFGQFNDNSPLMASYKFKESAAQGASASSMVYSDGNMGQFSMQMAIEEDYAFMKPLYRQFEAFLNYYINKKTRKYKFVFYLDGLDRSFWRKDKLQNLQNASSLLGITLDSQQWASAMGMNPQQFKRSMELAHYSDMTSMLTPLINANTMSNNGQAPKVSANDTEHTNKKDNSEISDSTAVSRDYEKKG